MSLECESNARRHCSSGDILCGVCRRSMLSNVYLVNMVFMWSFKLAMRYAIVTASFVLPTLVLACELNVPPHVSLGGGTDPFYEQLGPLASFRVRKIIGSFEVFKPDSDKETGKDIPLSKAELKLKNAISGVVVKASTTDDQGRFEVNDVPRGWYVLQIIQRNEPSLPWKIQGNLFVELRPDAKDLQLPVITLSMSDCGIGVTQKSK